MTIEERISQDAVTWRDSHIAPPFDTAFERALATPPRRRRAWLAAAAAVVLVAAIATFAATRSSQRPVPPVAPAAQWTTHSLNGGEATVRVPSRWHTTGYRGRFGTIYFPALFVSSAPFTGPCVSGAYNSACTSDNWFAPDWKTPERGVLVQWGLYELITPGSGLRYVPGRPTVVDGHPAKVLSIAPIESCPPGTWSEIDAEISVSTTSSERYNMVACLGQRASRADRAAVYTMLRSLKFRSR